jgi:hypothetical protein
VLQIEGLAGVELLLLQDLQLAIGVLIAALVVGEVMWVSG